MPLQPYPCLKCRSENLLIPENAEFFDTVTCMDCGSEYQYGELRSASESGPIEALPLANVEVVEE